MRPVALPIRIDHTHRADRQHHHISHQHRLLQHRQVPVRPLRPRALGRVLEESIGERYRPCCGDDVLVPELHVFQGRALGLRKRDEVACDTERDMSQERVVAARGERPVLESEDVGRVICVELPVCFGGRAVVLDANDGAVCVWG